MTVFVHAKTCIGPSQACYSPIRGNNAAASSRSPQQQEKPRPQPPAHPLAPVKSKQSGDHVGAGVTEHDAAGAVYMEGEPAQQERRRRRMGKTGSSALRVGTSAGAGDNAGAAWASPTAARLAESRFLKKQVSCGRTEDKFPDVQRPFRDEDAFATRMQRVRDTVLLLSKLCDERGTFGAAFESAWDRLVALGRGCSRTNRLGSDAAAESAQGPAHDGRPPPPFRTVRNHSNSLDVHQVLLNACVHSGMLILLDDAVLTPADDHPLLSTAQTRMGTSVSPPLSPQSGATPGLVNRTPWLESSSPSGLHQGPANATTGLTAGGARGPNCGGKSDEQQQQLSRELVDTSTLSGHASMMHAGQSTRQTTSSSAAAHVAAPGRYAIRSATFHLMQFTTQGVMFLPVQRLKHVLWMPWVSHMQDVAWTIHFYVRDATPEDFIPRKPHQLSTQRNTSASLLLPQSDSAAAGAEGHHDSLSAAPVSTGGTADADGWKLPVIAGIDASGGDGGHKSKVIVIQHAQTGRHYVEGRELKTTPRYELDWVCRIQVDKDALLKVFAPYQKYCVAARNAAAAASSIPPSPLPAPFVAPEIAAEVIPPPSHPHQRLSANEERRAVHVDGSFSNMRSGSAGEASYSRSPILGPAGALSLAPFVLNVGVCTAQQPQLLQREVLRASAEVVTARIEKPPHTLCMVSSTWRKRKEELDYVLKQQYKVQLEHVHELSKKVMD
ncbi:hypothetical protein LSCM4_05127 [Leishmania orientalis]|uniref:Uncharacterized protein n=1 Tax=Leishmania orientalis TaxID=2249476 RepID=A0A836KS30_9TRYP|nr:hypothetical protein LSCM4_05127 [Leishmania orientalis]